MKFSREFIEKVREATNLGDLIGQYTVLKNTGKNLMGRCPFPDHNDKSASFSVSEDKQLYHCFGCKKSGTAVHFAMDFLNYGFPEAIEFLAKRSGLEVEREPVSPAMQKEQDRRKTEREGMVHGMALASQQFIDNFRSVSSDHPVRVYAKKRGLTDELMAEFGIGYSENSWDQIKKLGLRMNIDEKLMIQSGLLIEKQRVYDRFRDRLMFPIRNSIGEVLGFGGRIIGEGEPKYLNSPETPLFHKGKMLYGLDVNARHIRSQDRILVVEGYMDLIGLAAFGVRNVAATLGTALTADHAKLIGRFTRNVTVLFDGDQAGQAASERSLPILLAAGLHPRALVLPDQMDPDEYVREHGAESLKSLLETAPELFELLISRWLKGFQGHPTQKADLVAKVSPIFNEMTDGSLRQLYLRSLASLIQVEEPWLRSAIWSKMKDLKGTSATQDQRPVLAARRDIPEMVSLSGMSKIELALLALTLLRSETYELVKSENAVEYIQHEGLKALISQIDHLYGQNKMPFDKVRASILSLIDRPDVLANLFEERESDQGVSEHKIVEDCIARLKEQSLKRQSQTLSREVKTAPTKEKLEEFMSLQKRRLGLSHVNDTTTE